MRALATFVVVATLGGCGFTAPTADDPGTGPDVDASVVARCLDADQDGACDDQTWACGVPPTSPSTNPLWGNVSKEAWWAHDVKLAGKGRFLVGSAGASVVLTFGYDWRVDCPQAPVSCTAQLEVGVVATGMSELEGCAADKPMGTGIDWTQPGSATISIPAESGIYDVRLNIAKNAACGSAITGAPSDKQTIAKICVP